MIDNISDNVPTCDVCSMSKWGVEMREDGELVTFCIVCSGDIVRTKEARDAAEALLNSESTTDSE